MSLAFKDKTNIPAWASPRMKLFGVELQKEMSSAEDGSLLVRGYFTSDNKDMTGDIITRGATERAVPAYRRWGNIRYMHLPRPVAKVARIGVEDGLAWNEVEIKVIDPQAKFEVENGLLAALSVGILINFDDIEFLEDGGLLINDYLLAEISLVDHPANYDAFLQGVKSIFTSIPEMSALQTLDEIKASVVSTNKENSMEETNVEITETTPVEEVATEETTQEETFAVDETPAQDEAEKSVDESTEEDAPQLDEEVTLKDVYDFLKSFEETFGKSMADVLEAIDKSLSSIKSVNSEVEAEAQVATEQSSDVEDTDESAMNDESSLPVNRDAAVQETTSLDQRETETPVAKNATLKSSIINYLEHRQ